MQIAEVDFSALSVGEIGLLLRRLRSGFLKAAEAKANGVSGEFEGTAISFVLPMMRACEGELLRRGISIRHPSFGDFIPFELTETG